MNKKITQSAETRRNLHTHTHTHTSKALLSIFVIFVFIFPSFSDPDIANNVTTPYCNDSVLESDTGPVNIEINWEPNEIELHWYDGDTELNVASESQSCLYDAALTAPTIIPTKTGYTFRGWRARCSLARLNPNITVAWNATHVRWKPISADGRTMTDDFGTENSSDLSPGEWAVAFSYGTVKGLAKCSSTRGVAYAIGEPSDAGGAHCWCAATNYTPDGGDMCNVVTVLWGYIHGDAGTELGCKNICAKLCPRHIMYSKSFRSALFGITQ